MMTRLIILCAALALVAVLVTAAAVVFVPASEPTTKIVNIGPTPLDAQIRYAIDHTP